MEIKKLKLLFLVIFLVFSSCYVFGMTEIIEISEKPKNKIEKLIEKYKKDISNADFIKDEKERTKKIKELTESHRREIKEAEKATARVVLQKKRKLLDKRRARRFKEAPLAKLTREKELEIKIEYLERKLERLKKKEVSSKKLQQVEQELLKSKRRSKALKRRRSASSLPDQIKKERLEEVSKEVTKKVDEKGNPKGDFEEKIEASKKDLKRSKQELEGANRKKGRAPRWVKKDESEPLVYSNRIKELKSITLRVIDKRKEYNLFSLIQGIILENQKEFKKKEKEFKKKEKEHSKIKSKVKRIKKIESEESIKLQKEFLQKEREFLQKKKVFNEEEESFKQEKSSLSYISKLKSQHYKYLIKKNPFAIKSIAFKYFNTKTFNSLQIVYLENGLGFDVIGKVGDKEIKLKCFLSKKNNLYAVQFAVSRSTKGLNVLGLQSNLNLIFSSVDYLDSKYGLIQEGLNLVGDIQDETWLFKNLNKVLKGKLSGLTLRLSGAIKDGFVGSYFEVKIFSKDKEKEFNLGEIPVIERYLWLTPGFMRLELAGSGQFKFLGKSVNPKVIVKTGVKVKLPKKEDPLEFESVLRLTTKNIGIYQKTKLVWDKVFGIDGYKLDELIFGIGWNFKLAMQIASGASAIPTSVSIGGKGQINNEPWWFYSKFSLKAGPLLDQYALYLGGTWQPREVIKAFFRKILPKQVKNINEFINKIPVLQWEEGEFMLVKSGGKEGVEIGLEPPIGKGLKWGALFKAKKASLLPGRPGVSSGISANNLEFEISNKGIKGEGQFDPIRIPRAAKKKERVLLLLDKEKSSRGPKFNIEISKNKKKMNLRGYSRIDLFGTGEPEESKFECDISKKKGAVIEFTKDIPLFGFKSKLNLQIKADDLKSKNYENVWVKGEFTQSGLTNLGKKLSDMADEQKKKINEEFEKIRKKRKKKILKSAEESFNVVKKTIDKLAKENKVKDIEEGLIAAFSDLEGKAKDLEEKQKTTKFEDYNEILNKALVLDALVKELSKQSDKFIKNFTGRSAFKRLTRARDSAKKLVRNTLAGVTRAVGEGLAKFFNIEKFSFDMNLKKLIEGEIWKVKIKGKVLGFKLPEKEFKVEIKNVVSFVSSVRKRIVEETKRMRKNIKKIDQGIKRASKRVSRMFKPKRPKTMKPKRKVRPIVTK